jgi:hypothetical protein
MSDKPGWASRKLEQRRQKKAMRGDSPERAAEHHSPKRGVVDRMLYASPGGQRRTNLKD